MSEPRHVSNGTVRFASRRDVLRAGLAAGAASVFASAARAQERVSLTEFIWTGAQEPVPRRLTADFLKANPNVSVEIISGTNAATFPKLKASVDISPDQPLLNLGFFNMDATAKGLASNLWLPLSPAVAPNVGQILDDYRQPGDLGAFFCMDVGGIIYNTDKIKTPPTSWADIFDPKYKGRVALFDSFWAGNGLVVTARLNGGSEDNIDPAMKMYADAAAAGQFHSLYTSNSQLQQLMVSGEVWMAPYFRGVALPWAKDGAPVAYAVPKEGQVAFPEGFQLVKGSTAAQQKAAADLVNLMLEPASVLDYCQTAAVLPLMKNVQLPAELASDPAVQPDAIARAIKLDWAKIAANTPKWQSAWNRDVKANLR